MSFILGNGQSTRGQTQTPETSLRLQSSTNGAVIPFGYGRNRVAGNVIWYDGFTYTAAASPDSGGGKGGSSGGGGGKDGSPSSGSYNYSTNVAIALCEGPIDQVLMVWNGKTPSSLGDLNFTAFDGPPGQAIWGFLTADYPNAAIGYSNLAYVGAAPLALGNNADMPNYTFDVSFAIDNAVTELYTVAAGSSYSFTPTYWSLASSIIESEIIPTAPYQIQASNYTALNAYPVILGSVASASIVTSSSAGVIFADTNTVLTRVSSGPTTGQYSVTAAGLYQFAAADAGRPVTIIDFAISPGVNYVVTLTATITANSETVTWSAATGTVVVGEIITGPGIPAGTVVVTVGTNTLTMSQPATAGSSASVYVTGEALTQVLGTPGQGQFSVSVQAPTYGQYLFSSADNGQPVMVIDVPDADPTLVITDALSGPTYGCGFPAAYIGSLATLQNYTFALGLFVSPVAASSEVANSFFADLATGLNFEFVWSSGSLTAVPYGDQTVTGFGKTYTAPSSAIYSLGDDDFLRNESTGVGTSAFSSDDPVLGSRTPQKSATNDIKVEYLDRGNSYNPAIAEAQDDAAINDYGLRPADTKTLHFFCFEAAAQQSAQLQLGRQNIRNNYAITVPWYFILPDPMDIIEITDTACGLVNQWVRILEITENQQDATLSMTVEEVLDGSGSSPQYGSQAKVSYTPNYNLDPGDVNAPLFFEPPAQVTPDGGLNVGMAVSGQSTGIWGGCDVWVSGDGEVYRQVGTVNGGARQGVLSSPFPSGSDPDTVNTLAVDLTMSAGTLSSGTESAANANNTDMWVDGEIIAFSAVTMTGNYQYSMGTYLRRGQFGTTISSHLSGANVARMDTGIFYYNYDKSQVGNTIYIKLLSFNIWGGGAQALEDVEPFDYTIQGPPKLPDVTGFTVQQNGDVVVFTWDAVPNDWALKGYLIGYAPQGSTSWSSFEILTEATAGTEMSNAAVPPGTWTFGIRAIDLADNLSPDITMFNLTVVNTDDIISEVDQSQAGWPGTLSGFVAHYSGVLDPLGTNPVSTYQTVGTITSYAFNQSLGGTLPAATIYFTLTAVTTSGTEGATEAGTYSRAPLNQFFIEGLGNPIPGYCVGWNLYAGYSSGTQTKQNATPIPFATGWTEPTSGYLTSGASPPMSNITGWEWVDFFCPDPVSSASYTAPTVDTGYNESLRVLSTYSSMIGSTESGNVADLVASIDTWLTGQTDPNVYNPWTVGTVTLRYLNYRLTYSGIAFGNVSYIQDFTTIIDTAPQTETQMSVTIAGLGSTVTFAPAFHTPPFVQATVVGSTALYATVSSVTATTCVINVWNSSGTSVGGSVNLTAIGS